MFDANPQPPGGQPAHVVFHADNPALEICRPAAQCVPLVFASPHSGRRYPDALLAASGLDLPTLRASEDAFVDQLFDWVPSLGAPLLLAHFPRVWVDANRDAREIDPAMFLDPVPAAAHIASARVGAGLGVIPKVVADGQAIRSRPLTWAEGAARLAQCHTPYHHALAALIAETRARFGVTVLIDCHSMPSAAVVRGGRHAGPDIVLGDGYGASAGPWLMAHAEQAFTTAGFAVKRNHPYAGGYTTRHYGRPRDGVHALQIEINRRLYMDEKRVSPGPDLPAARRRLAGAVEDLVTAIAGLLREARAAE